jgi:hypothetical protein
VPVIWDDGNTQIKEIWTDFPSAMPLYSMNGRASLNRASQNVEASKRLLRDRISASIAKFERIWHNFLS